MNVPKLITVSYHLDFWQSLYSSSMFNDGHCNNSRVVSWKFKHDTGDIEKLVMQTGERRGRAYGVVGTGEFHRDETFIFLELEKKWLILVSSGT